MQCCGSGYIESGSGSGSSKFRESGSGPRSTFFHKAKFKTKIFDNKIFIFKYEPKLNPEITRYLATSWPVEAKYRKWKKITNISLKKTWFLVSKTDKKVALDPDPDPGRLLNPDPIRIRIHNTDFFHQIIDVLSQSGNSLTDNSWIH